MFYVNIIRKRNLTFWCVNNACEYFRENSHPSAGNFMKFINFDLSVLFTNWSKSDKFILLNEWHNIKIIFEFRSCFLCQYRWFCVDLLFQKRYRRFHFQISIENKWIDSWTLNNHIFSALFINKCVKASDAFHPTGKTESTKFLSFATEII